VVVLLAILASQIVFTAIPTAEAITFGSPIQISTSGVTFVDSESDVSPVVVDGSNVYIVWVDLSTGTSDIMFAKSTDSGQTFNPPINISNNAGSSRSPQIAISGNNVYVTWHDATLTTVTTTQIFFSVSHDSGNSFSSPIRLSTGNSAVEPMIAISGNNVYISWHGSPPAGSPSGLSSEINFVKSIDSGDTFTLPIYVSNTSGASVESRIFAIGNNVYIAWSDTIGVGNSEALIVTSSNSGTSFGAPINVSNTSGGSNVSDIIALGDDVYITWVDGTTGNNEILFSKSSDSGASFDSPINLSNSLERSASPKLASSTNHVFVAWHDTRVGYGEVFVSTSSDSGTSFAAPIHVSAVSGLDGFADVASSGNNVYVTWASSTGSPRGIWVSESIDSGNTFDTPVEISNGLANGNGVPQLAVSGAFVGIAWFQDGLVNDIYFNSNADDIGPVNDPPIANDDVYFVNEDESLIIPAPGVIANDDDGDAELIQVLTATIVSTTTNGFLSLNSDGSFTYIPNSNFNGQDSFTYTITDGEFESTATVTITIEPVNDTPQCDAASTNIAFLWPPNHKMIPISVTMSATDVDGDVIVISISSIFQDEPTNGLGDGDTSPDAILSPAQLRAERSGTGDGRIYVVTVVADDGNGGVCGDDVEILVPHSMKKPITAVNSGTIYDSTAP